MMSIVIEQLSFAYNSCPILDSISVSIPTGEIWALVGRSGVGKTTLLQILAGLFKPQHGSITIGQRRFHEAGQIKGVVFQEDSLLGWLTVQDNILFPRNRDPNPQLASRAADILENLGLTQYANSLPMTLSAGMRKRVEFGRALMADAHYLLADEPFGTLDALTRRDLWNLWNRLRKTEPRTGILCTHDPEEAIYLCDVILPLIPGPPATLGEIFQVPKHLSAMNFDQRSEELLALKEELVRALKPRASFVEI
jgi:ABC-type nitrate/sulfonate/bicarbonate transport system ATPase subunit